jgi:hypothetical protein
MAGGIGGVFLVAVFGAAAVCGGILIPRLYRAGSAGQGASAAAGQAARAAADQAGSPAAGQAARAAADQAGSPAAGQAASPVAGRPQALARMISRLRS